MSNRGSSSRRARLRKRLEALESECWLCGYPLYPDAEPFTDFATEVDEFVPASKGGDVYGIETPCHLVHRCCNIHKSNQVLQQFALSEWFESNHLSRESYTTENLPDFWVS